MLENKTNKVRLSQSISKALADHQEENSLVPGRSRELSFSKKMKYSEVKHM